jgi:hypothetical protein
VKQVTRAIRPEDLTELLEHPPRATLAFVRDGAIEAVPVAFRLVAGRYLFGLLPPAGRLPDHGKLLVDDGPWYFDLRGAWMRGAITPCEPPIGEGPELSWHELLPIKSVAWHYGTMRAR